MNANTQWNLNPQQFEAVLQTEGPLLIIAGAGSGKTRVLMYRFAHIVAEKLAQPDEILAVTFTNKAAGEMLNRVSKIINLRYEDRFSLWVSTFHSMCSKILREHIHLLGYENSFNIYDSGDQLSQIKKIMIRVGLDTKNYPPKAFQSRINNLKNLAVLPHEVGSKGPYIDPKSAEVYKYYEQEMKKSNALDFSDLLLKTQILFKKFPDILKLYQQKFKYIMIDEYQDTNHIQYLLVKYLAQGHSNICVVGDEDQSIYSWRGADISNILNFSKDFVKAKTIKLEQNYRSTQIIVEAANELIKNNTSRNEKKLFTENPEGELIHVQEEQNEHMEARFVVDNIKYLLEFDTKLSYSDFALFYRTNAQSRVLEDQLRKLNIPYKVVGGLKFYERMEVKNVIAYLRVLISPQDDVAIKRIINVPARGIGKTSIQKIEKIAFRDDVSFFEALQKGIEEKVVHQGAQNKIQGFLNLIDSFQEKACELSLPELLEIVIEDSGYLAKLALENTVESQTRIENIDELKNAIVQFCKERDEEATLVNYLQEIALVEERNQNVEDKNYVTLMTMHISKGLEFPVVFIVGLEEGLFPSAKSIESEDEELLEEERRVCYVGMTRAEKRLYLTYARSRRTWGQVQFNSQSRFIDEIPSKYLKLNTTNKRPKFMDKYKSQDSENSFDDFPDYESFDDSQASSPFRTGQKVKHPNFGFGSVIKIEGKGEDLKVSVVFTNQAIKKFVAKYANLTPY